MTVNASEYTSLKESGGPIFIEGNISYEKPHNEGIYYRLYENSDEPIAKELNFKSRGLKNIVTVSAPQNDGSYTKVIVVHSRPAWYTDKNENFRIIDLVVSGDPKESEESVVKRYDEIASRSEQYRTEVKNFVESQIVPVLEDFKGVVCIVGRGDIYDHTRIPSINETHPSDVDLILFTDYESNKSYADQLNMQLKQFAEAHPSIVISSHVYKVRTNGFSGSQSTFSARRSEEQNTFDGPPMVVSIDIMPLPSLIKFAQNASPEKMQEIVGPYERRLFEYGSEVLFDKSNGKYDLLRHLAIIKTQPES